MMSKRKFIALCIICLMTVATTTLAKTNKESITLSTLDNKAFTYGDTVDVSLCATNIKNKTSTLELNLVYQLDKGAGFEDVSYNEFKELYSIEINSDWRQINDSSFNYNNDINPKEVTSSLIKNINVTDDMSKTLYPFKIVVEGVFNYE